MSEADDALRQSTVLVGSFALLGVLCTATSFLLVERVLFAGYVGQPGGATHDLLWTSTGVLYAIASRWLVLIAVVAGGYLTAVRQLPTAPCLAGAFLGGLVAAAGQALVVGLVPGDVVLLHEAVAREFVRWIARFVVPVMGAVLLGAVLRRAGRRGRSGHVHDA